MGGPGDRGVSAVPEPDGAVILDGTRATFVPRRGALCPALARVRAAPRAGSRPPVRRHPCRLRLRRSLRALVLEEPGGGPGRSPPERESPAFAGHFQCTGVDD